MKNVKNMVALFALSLVAVLTATFPKVPVRADAIPSRQKGYSYTVPAHGSRSFRVTYRGGQPARVEATGNGDIDLYVLGSSNDANDDAIVSDTLPDSYPMCDWTPGYTRTYTIRVVNCEDSAVTFDLATN